MAQKISGAVAIEKLAFFKALTAAETQMLKSGMSARDYKAGQPVCSYNFADSPGLLLVQSGRVNLFLSAENARQCTVGVMRAGDMIVLPERALRPDSGFVLFTEAERDARVTFVTAKAWKFVTESNLSAMNYSLRASAEIMTKIALSLYQLFAFNVKARLALFLLDESDRAGGGEIRVTHERVARSLSTSREVVTRLLGELGEAGAIVIGRGRIRVADERLLRESVRKGQS